MDLIGLLLSFLAVTDLNSSQNQEQYSRLYQDVCLIKNWLQAHSILLSGFNRHPGELDDLSLESFEAIGAKCGQFKDRSEKLLSEMEAHLNVRDKRYLKVLMKETEFCFEGSKAQVFMIKYKSTIRI